MAISELSTQEREKLSEKYIELNNIVNQREELDTKMIPLCEKLDELEAEETRLNKEYDEILLLNKERFTSKYTSRLSNITNRYVEISREKEAIKKEMMGLSNDFFSVRKEESILRESIEAIANKKKGSTFSENDEIVRLDKKGNVINKIVVNSSNFSKIILGGNQNVNREENTITKTNRNVLNVIAENFKKTKNFMFELSSKLVDRFSKFINDVFVEEFKKGYTEEEERVQNIINNYNKIRQEKAKVEEEADNLEFFGKNDITNSNEVPNDMDTSVYYSNSDKEEKSNDIVIDSPNIEVLPVNSMEVKVAKTIDLGEVIDVVDSNSLQNDKPLDYQEESQTSNTINLVTTGIEVKLEGDQAVKNSSITIAKSDKNKKSNMIALFKTGIASGIGKVAANISNNKALRDAKRDVLKEINNENQQELDKIKNTYRSEIAKLEELKHQQLEEAQKRYKDQIENIEKADADINIFSDQPRSMAA